MFLHLNRDHHLKRRLEIVAHGDHAPDGEVLRDQLAREHLSGLRFDPEPAARRHIAKIRRADDRLRLHLAIFDHPHRLRRRGPASHRRVRALLDPLEDEALLMRRVENGQGEQRQVQGPQQVADVVPRAFLGDQLRLVRRGRGRRNEQLHQPLIAIAHGLAVHIEHVAELHPPAGADRADEEQIRFELAVRHTRRRAS